MVIRKSIGDSVNVSAHGGTFISPCVSYRSQELSFLTTYAFGREHTMVTIALFLRRIVGPKVREGTLHPSSFRVMTVSMGNAISW